MPLGKRLAAEFVGTFWLVLLGCGSAVLATGNLDVGIGWLGVAFAFGLTVLTMAFAVGHISGGHFNPAVTIGLWMGKRAESRVVLPYVVTQVVAAILAAAVLYGVASGKSGFSAEASGFATNGYGDHSPEGYNLGSAFITEFVLTAGFLIVILGATDRRAPKGFAPLAIGLALTLAHLFAIPVTNASLNPARSTGPALFVGDWWALGQLWLFWVAPILGAALAGYAYRYITGETGVEPIAEEGQEPDQAVVSAGDVGGVPRRARPPSGPGPSRRRN